MRTQKNVAQLMIASSIEEGDEQLVTALESNEMGVVCVYDASGTLNPGECFDDAKPLAAGDIFYVAVKRADGSVERSDTIHYDNIVSVSVLEGTAAVEQIDYIGYDATNDTGSIDVINSNPYYATFLLQGGNMATFAEREKLFAIYKSDSTATQYEIANGLATTAVENMKYFRKGYKPLQFDVVSSATVTAANGFKNAQDVTVVNGSKVITCTTDVTYEAAGGATLVVGDYVRIGAVGAGTALTDPVYKVTAISTVYVTLDRAVTAASGTYTAVDGTSDIEVIPAATGAAGDWGMKVTGVTPSVVAGYVHKEPIRFESAILDAGDTDLSKEAVQATRGLGTADYIAQLEKELEGTRGVVYRSSPQYELPRTSYASISSGGLYDVATITYRKNSTNMLDADTVSHGELILAISEGNDHDDVAVLADIFAVDEVTE